MCCLGFKGGIGTSSRVTPAGHTVAVLLLTNFGERKRLTVAGVPVGALLPAEDGPPSRPAPASASWSPTRPSAAPTAPAWPVGSVSGWRARDPRPTTAAARSSWASRRPRRFDRDGRPEDGPRVAGRGLDDLFEAVVDAAEESVLNSLLGAPTTVGRDGNTSEGLDPEVVVRLLAEAGRAGTEREVRIAMPDGIGLAATFYLPDESSGPQPCLLEALPYRKDDLTSSYAESYVALRDEHEYAVCRLDLRGTGSSEGDATDEYPEAEQTDLVEVIAWLADQPWCDGNVGMWGTSYSGFNSLQIACERPPALKAVCAIYASDDRWTDDVHWRGGALRLVDLVDYCHYMTPMCVLPPVPAVWGDSVARGVAAPAGDQRAVGADLAAREPRRPLLAARLGAHRRRGPRLRPDRLRGDDRRRVGRRLPQQLLPHGRGAARPGVPHRLLAGPWVHADPTTAYPGPRIDLDREMVAWWDRWLRGRDETPHQRRRRRVRADLDPARGVPRRARGPLDPRHLAVAVGVGRDASAARTRALVVAAGRRHRRLDRLRRPPAVGAVDRPARGRRTLAGLGVGGDAARARPAPGAAAPQRGRTAGVAVGEALRRLPRRHLRADHPRHPRPRLPRGRARTRHAVAAGPR